MNSEFISQNISAIILFAGIIGAFIFFLAGILSRILLNSKIKRCTLNVVANAYDIFLTGDGLGDKRVRLKYVVNGVEYNRMHPRTLNLTKVHLEKGQDIEIYCNPNKPEEYVFKEVDIPKSKSSFVLGIIGGIIVLGVCSIVAFAFK